MKLKANLPKDGIAGLKENFASDASSGFIVFLLALPLSLGIAKASDFPPIMGLITAIIGGIVVSLFMGSRLSIKGPAAGLIVIVAGAVSEFGGGELGWHLALGAMVVAGIVQILFGVFKLGKLMDFFPLSAVHGMLAAIGLIIIGKQIPVFLDVNPALTKGKEPLELLASIPEFIREMDPRATIIGAISLAIMMLWPFIKNPIIKKVPAPLVVLCIAIPAELYMDFQHTEPKYALVHIGNLLDNVKWNVDFSGIQQTGIFIKFVIMFALVGSLESLLTVKAMDMLDPFRRKSDANKDLIATGIGNTIAAVLGGLPMISEVARSSANIANGAKTRWANFFHGFFILIFVLLASHLIELIPNTALAAMLITVGVAFKASDLIGVTSAEGLTTLE
ncbi:MAG: SulP family inorganic anion transporter, partial [Aquirufa sp.]